MNPNLQRLHPYPFERLAALLSGITPAPGYDAIVLSIGEPRHRPPEFIIEAMTRGLGGLGRYPVALGLAELREAGARWLTRRYDLPRGALDPRTMILPVNGTREALFSFVQAVVDSSSDPLVLMPNPFYQIYEGGALLAGADPHYLDTIEANAFLPDLEVVPDEVWRRCQLLFLCSPGNPTGAVMSEDYLRRAIELADRYDFVIAADECYSEIYFDEASPPPGILQVCTKMGRDDFSRCVVFHSLSKRSSVPGLRSGFVAGDRGIMTEYLRYRTYHGCAVPEHTQLASVPAWDDDAHVAANRDLYREKFNRVMPIIQSVMAVDHPDAAFYLWLRIDSWMGDGERFARDLHAEKNVTVLPGTYLSRDTEAGNPGHDRVRISLVASVEDCVDAAERIRDFVSNHE